MYLSQRRGEGECIYVISVPVSDARRDVLRAAEGPEPLLDKAGLAGANIFNLFIPF